VKKRDSDAIQKQRISQPKKDREGDAKLQHMFLFLRGSLALQNLKLLTELHRRKERKTQREPHAQTGMDSPVINSIMFALKQDLWNSKL
jgi:hypothetical protein